MTFTLCYATFRSTTIYSIVQWFGTESAGFLIFLASQDPAPDPHSFVKNQKKFQKNFHYSFKKLEKYMICYLFFVSFSFFFSKMKGEFFWIFVSFCVRYLTLLHLPPLRFHCVGGCWDRTQDSNCDNGIGCQKL